MEQLANQLKLEQNEEKNTKRVCEALSSSPRSLGYKSQNLRSIIAHKLGMSKGFFSNWHCHPKLHPKLPSLYTSSPPFRRSFGFLKLVFFYL
jgi:hypothetical protein